MSHPSSLYQSDAPSSSSGSDHGAAVSLPALEQWTQTLTEHLPHLSKPQAAMLALMSFGMVWARSCAISAVSAFLSPLLGEKPNTLRQRLREFCYEASQKRGKKRIAVEPSPCFSKILGWIMSLWKGREVALALDATTLSDRFIVLAVSVLYRGCAIPVAWTIVSAQKKEGWRKHWLRMLRQLRPGIPKNKMVIVLADRGIYARWLFKRICRLGWHPLLRINSTGKFRPEGNSVFWSLNRFAPEPGTCWAGVGEAFSTKECRLHCTLLACWSDGHDEAWLLLTDLSPDKARACWYGLRAWIEQGFKVIKRAGWQWHKTRMTDPQRAARLWLAVSVATLWLLSVGGLADQNIPESTIEALPNGKNKTPRQRKATQARLISVFRLGWTIILAAIVRRKHIPKGRFIPSLWPTENSP